MYQTLSLVKRNIKIYLRDPMAVFSSLISVMVLMLIYILFLGDIGDHSVRAFFSNENQIKFSVYSQMMAGVIVLNTVTIPLGYLGSIVSDFQNRQIDAFMVTPVKRYKVILGYYLASLTITLVFSLLMWYLAVIIIGLVTGIFYSFSMILYVSLWILILVFISTSFMILLTTFINSINAFGAISGIFGGFVGFVSGIYLPITQNSPQILRIFSSLVPFSHMSIHLKNILMQPSYEMILNNTGGDLAAVDKVRDVFGATELGFLGLDISSGYMILFAAIISVGIFFLSTYRLSRKIKRQ